MTFSSCGAQWFASSAKAKACIDSTVAAYDDCDPKVAVSSALVTSSSSKCATTEFTISAVESRCKKQTNAVFVVKVDNVPPATTCTLKNGKKDLVLQAIGSNVLEDLGLVYTTNSAPGDCASTHNITVTVYANELEDFQSQVMATFYQYGDPLKRSGLYVAKGYCQTANNGQCIIDPATSNNRVRVYTIEVSATDEAGNVGTGLCRAIVLPTASYNKYTKGQLNATAVADQSTQRFLLTQYTHSFHT
jgi:hypothetical protein